MKVLTMEQGTEAWFDARRGKITGTRLADMWVARAYTVNDVKAKLDELAIPYLKSATKGVLEGLLPESARIELELGGPKKVGFYETLAEMLGIDPDEEDRMGRGLRLEDDAASNWEADSGKHPVKVGICVSDVDPRIIQSPDRLVEIPGVPLDKTTEALEIKCLSPARHLQAVVENRIPDEFESQKIQYFIVNPHLQVLHFVFYDPRIKSAPYFTIDVTREELGDKPDKYLRFQLQQLQELDEIAARLAF